jgi:hypothetical protein
MVMETITLQIAAASDYRTPTVITDSKKRWVGPVKRKGENRHRPSK